MSQETQAEAGPAMRAFDQPGNVGHHEGAKATTIDNAEIRRQRGKGIVGDLGPGGRDTRDQCGLACVGKTEQPHIRQELELET